MSRGEASLPFLGASSMPWTGLNTITITRPNDVTAYAVGDVYGDAADARQTITGLAPNRRLSVLRTHAIQQRSPADAAMTFSVIFSTAFATVIGDNAPLALSDADITTVVAQPFYGGNATGQNAAGFTQNNTQTLLNMSAGAAGRRSSIISWSNNGWPVPANGQLQFYIILGAAYTPLALEVITMKWYASYLD